MTLTGHVLNTTDPVVLRPGGTNGTQVLQGITYYVRRVDANTIQLHSTAANASSNTSALTLTGISGTLDRRWISSEWWSSQFNSVKLKGKCRFSGKYLEDPNWTNGLAFSTVFGVGGATSQSMLSTLSADAVVLPRHLTELQTITSNGPLLIWIQVGGNDRSGSIPAATVQANVQAMIDLWKAGWAAAGGAASDLYFVLMLNHPQQSVAENLNDAYHTAYDTLCTNNPRTANVKIKTLASAGEMQMQGATVWFDSGGDAHLTAAGYTELGNRIISALCG
jgi:lysophospholipase L1-like esterase